VRKHWICLIVAHVCSVLGRFEALLRELGKSGPEACESTAVHHSARRKVSEALDECERLKAQMAASVRWTSGCIDALAQGHAAWAWQIGIINSAAHNPHIAACGHLSMHAHMREQCVHTESIKCTYCMVDKHAWHLAHATAGVCCEHAWTDPHSAPHGEQCASHPSHQRALRMQEHVSLLTERLAVVSEAVLASVAHSAIGVPEPGAASCVCCVGAKEEEGKEERAMQAPHGPSNSAACVEAGKAGAVALQFSALQRCAGSKRVRAGRPLDGRGNRSPRASNGGPHAIEGRAPGRKADLTEDSANPNTQNTLEARNYVAGVVDCSAGELVRLATQTREFAKESAKGEQQDGAAAKDLVRQWLLNGPDDSVRSCHPINHSAPRPCCTTL
jgi:hypothetical protein